MVCIEGLWQWLNCWEYMYPNTDFSFYFVHRIYSMYMYSHVVEPFAEDKFFKQKKKGIKLYVHIL